MVICINGVFGISETKNDCQTQDSVKSVPKETEHILTKDEDRE